MKILIVDKSGIIPTINYGGTERVIWGLGKELTLLGHEVFYLVKEGSTCDFAEILVLKDEINIESQIPKYIDIVHLNFRLKQPITSKPYLITMHGNPSKEELIDINTVFISKNQAERYQSSMYVHNGLDWSDYPAPNLDTERTYFHFLGKAAWKVKNVFGAAKIALESNNKLHIMGGKRWTFRNLKRGFGYVLNPKIIFRGMVDNNVKMDIMKNSKALLFPVSWHEPFGLAIIESLYAGCAVFGTKNGSLPELITPEVGFIGDCSSEIVKAIQEFDYNPKLCHEYATKYFNSNRMAESYVILYKKILSGDTLNQKVPQYDIENNKIAIFN
ncbi:glycosyltransferase [Aquimarina sp. 2-A2]|uniref:glycosyltransferase n=1 Tax=Aquimarina sp. 2-A2 TaxID=3382644 RepID=UPI00387EEEDD